VDVPSSIPDSGVSPAKFEIPLNELVCTQVGVRNISVLPSMVKHVRNGHDFSVEQLHSFARQRGIMNLRPTLIQVIRFGDSVTYLNDGHHRIMALLLGGRDTLRPSGT
jgi:hypothetical protein